MRRDRGKWRRHRVWTAIDPGFKTAAAQLDAQRRSTFARSARADATGCTLLLLDRQSTRRFETELDTLPLEYIDQSLQFHPEWVVDKIAPPDRSSPRMTTGWSRRKNPSISMPRPELKKLITLDRGHYEVYAEPAFSAVMEPSPGSRNTCPRSISNWKAPTTHDIANAARHLRSQPPGPRRHRRHHRHRGQTCATWSTSTPATAPRH